MSEEMIKKTVSRRDFLKIAGVAGATIGVGAGLGGLVAACGGGRAHHYDRGPDGGHQRAHHDNGPGGAPPRSAPRRTWAKRSRWGFEPSNRSARFIRRPDQYCVDRWESPSATAWSEATARCTPSP